MADEAVRARESLVIHCLHGTFQDPAVWVEPMGRVARRLADGPGARRQIRVAMETVEAVDATSPTEWVARWLERLPRPTSGSRSRGPVLLGYSLGGRLALHALLAEPDRWSAAVLVAAHPGDRSDAARAETAMRDAVWAARCRRDAWDSLLADWDALPVFAGRSNRAPRDPARLDRDAWAAAFERLGRGRQDDLRSRLVEAAQADVLPPILYVSGEEDPTYRALGDELVRLAPDHVAHVPIAGAAHRVPWERPAAFAAAVAAFLDRVLSRPAPPPIGGRGGTRRPPRSS